LPEVEQEKPLVGKNSNCKGKKKGKQLVPRKMASSSLVLTGSPKKKRLTERKKLRGSKKEKGIGLVVRRPKGRGRPRRAKDLAKGKRATGDGGE